MWQWLDQYLTFSKGERRAIIGIVVITTVIVAGLYAYSYFTLQPTKANNDPELEAFLKGYNEKKAEASMSLTNPNEEEVTEKPKSATSTSLWVIDINEADSAAFEKLSGIGPVLARRIINFRNSLGGFVSLEQIGEVYGLPDSTYQKVLPQLKLKNGSHKTINVNTDDEAVIAKHPYISNWLAKAICAQRKIAPFKSVSDLKELKGLNEEVWVKIKPYVTVD